MSLYPSWVNPRLFFWLGKEGVSGGGWCDKIFSVQGNHYFGGARQIF